MKTRLREPDPPRKRAPTDPLRAAFAETLRGVLLDLHEQGLLGGNPSTPPRLAFSPEEFGPAIGMSGAKIRQLIRRGMPAIRVGAQLRIVPAEALAWMREHGDYLPADGASEGDD